MDQPVTGMRDETEDRERLDELLISGADKGVGRETVRSSTDQIRYLDGIEASLGSRRCRG